MTPPIGSAPHASIEAMRVAAVIAANANGWTETRASEMAHVAGLDRGQFYRGADWLVARGYADKTGDGFTHYRLTPAGVEARREWAHCLFGDMIGGEA